MMKRATILALSILVAACATQGTSVAPPPAPPIAPASTPWVDDGESEIVGAHYDGSGRPLVGSSTTLSPALQDRFESRAIGEDAPPPAPTRPPRVGRRDIALRSARLDNALRWLAREGRFNLVVEGDLADSVSLELFAVEPYDAALALVEANHLHLRYQTGIVIVGRGNR